MSRIFIFLDVLPALESVFEEMTVQPGAFISLKCTAVGQPLPQFHWTLDDSPIPVRDMRYRMREYVDSHGKMVSYLNVSNVQIGDGGEYRCIASNKAGKFHHSAKIHVVGELVLLF